MNSVLTFYLKKQQIRLYCKINDEGKLQNASEALNVWCNKEQCSLVFCLCIDVSKKKMIKSNTLDYEVFVL